jgi:hypothetical protein
MKVRVTCSQLGDAIGVAAAASAEQIRSVEIIRPTADAFGDFRLCVGLTLLRLLALLISISTFNS